MSTLVFEDFTSDEQVQPHSNEHATAGFTIAHKDSKFKVGLLELTMTHTRKSLLSKVDLTGLPRPVSMCSSASQLETYLPAFAVLLPYIAELRTTDDYVYRVKLLTAGMCAFTGELLHRIGDRLPLAPRLGETLSANYANGTQACFEQISTSPSTCRMLLTGEGFKLHGALRLVADLSLTKNSAELANHSKLSLELEDGYNYSVKLFNM